MELIVWDGVTSVGAEEEDLEPDIKVHDFTAISEDTICTVDSDCFGWSLDGTYTIETLADGSSSLTVDANVQSPSSLNTNGVLGVGWGIGYEVDGE